MNREGVMETEAIEGLVALASLIRKARNIGGWYEADVISTDHIESDLVATALIQAARADPAAARAIRDAIDPDGLRDALRGLLLPGAWQEMKDAPGFYVTLVSAANLNEWRHLIEGTPDAD